MEYQVEIEKIDHFGRGIGKINNKVIFVPHTLKNDIVLVKIVKDKKKFLEGEVLKYIKKSPRTALCPYNNDCGGCPFIDISYDEQLQIKTEKVKDLFKRELGIPIKIEKVISDSNTNYRNKIRLHGKDKKLGFYKEKTNDLVTIDKCIISKDEINSIIKRLNSVIDNNIDEVAIRSNKEVMLDIKGSISKDIVLNNFKDIDTIYLNDFLIKGEGYITEDILGKTFMISNKSFFQVNTKVCSKIFYNIVNYLKEKKYHNALDLYCGVGLIGILISDFVDSVTGIEVVSDAIKNANQNKKLNKVNNVNFICDKVENRIHEFRNIDLIIVDPPRSGLDKKSITSMIEILPKAIIYISCNPNTLVRDLKDLLEHYKMERFFIADMFPNTYHVECVGLLCLKETSKSLEK